MESKHIGYVFPARDETTCHVLKISTDDAAAADNYTGDGTLDSYVDFFDNNNIEYIVEWERPRYWPKGRI